MHIDSTTPLKPRRVLSPHLQIYRLPLTALLSISHRISGAFLALGFIFGNLLLVTAAINVPLFESLTEWLTHPFGRIFVAGWLVLFNFHLVHGVRHLFWDLSRGFTRSKQTTLGVIEIVSALILTLMMVLTPWLLETGGTL